jgi:HPt (histidine-containing phosphotransfer) domain-containing protein
MTENSLPIIDWPVFSRARSQLGASFVRILGYFVEDGMKAVDSIENAMRAHDAAAMVIPACTLKTESRQFGGEQLGQLAEDIEDHARHCVEMHLAPDDYIEQVVRLRPLLEEMLSEIQAETNPLMQRRPGLGRHVA